MPDSLKFVQVDAWQIDEVKLPDISNQIVFVGPTPKIPTSRWHSRLACCCFWLILEIRSEEDRCRLAEGGAGVGHHGLFSRACH